jgi:hypothetical protein
VRLQFERRRCGSVGLALSGVPCASAKGRAAVRSRWATESDQPWVTLTGTSGTLSVDPATRDIGVGGQCDRSEPSVRFACPVERNVARMLAGRVLRDVPWRRALTCGVHTQVSGCGIERPGSPGLLAPGSTLAWQVVERGAQQLCAPSRRYGGSTGSCSRSDCEYRTTANGWPY